MQPREPSYFFHKYSIPSGHIALRWSAGFGVYRFYSHCEAMALRWSAGFFYELRLCGKLREKYRVS